MTTEEKIDISNTLCGLYGYLVQVTMSFKKKNYDEVERNLFCALHLMELDMPAYVDSCGQMINYTIKNLKEM